MQKKIYFIGIGGISMSSLAVFLSVKGEIVSGSDFEYNENLKVLDNFGIKYYIGHKKTNIENFNPDLVVINCAIKNNNEELIWAIKNKKKIIKRAEILAKISNDFKNVIAISGTHGKTTTTALISEIFINANLKPTVHIGGVLKKNGCNFLLGEKKFFITEACEYQNSFLSLTPTVGIVINEEPDHLDFFKNFNDIDNSFKSFLKNSKIKIYQKNNYNYILENENQIKNYSAKNIILTSMGYKFDFYENDLKIFNIQTNFIGSHNINNVIIACIVAKLFKIKHDIIKKSIKNFHGVKRRFELINKIKNCLVIHDYAHHPTEIYNTINQAKLYGKVLTVFQPHTFSRTKSLLQQFINSFDKTDGLILLKTYPARETETPKSSAEYLYNEIIRNNKLFTNYYSTNLIIKKNNKELKIKIPIYLKLYFKKNRNIRKLIPIIYLKDFFIAKEIIMQNIINT